MNCTYQTYMWNRYVHIMCTYQGWPNHGSQTTCDWCYFLVWLVAQYIRTLKIYWNWSIIEKLDENTPVLNLTFYQLLR